MDLFLGCGFAYSVWFVRLLGFCLLFGFAGLFSMFFSWLIILVDC